MPTTYGQLCGKQQKIALFWTNSRGKSGFFRSAFGRDHWLNQIIFKGKPQPQNDEIFESFFQERLLLAGLNGGTKEEENNEKIFAIISANFAGNSIFSYDLRPR